jgi:hypothetical protein
MEGGLKYVMGGKVVFGATGKYGVYIITHLQY